jgi:Rad3-related DNA helicase
LVNSICYEEADRLSTWLAGKREMIHNNISAFHQVEAFLLTLTEANEDGRILLFNNPSIKDGINHPHITIRYILLNPAEHFGSVVQEARSVVLAGGTMAPVRETIIHYRVTRLICDPTDERLYATISNKGKN